MNKKEVRKAIKLMNEAGELLRKNGMSDLQDVLWNIEMVIVESGELNE